jgi:hypothetical protein
VVHAAVLVVSSTEERVDGCVGGDVAVGECYGSGRGGERGEDGGDWRDISDVDMGAGGVEAGGCGEADARCAA